MAKMDDCKGKKPGKILGLFDFNQDGKLDIIEKTIALSVLDDLLSEDEDIPNLKEESANIVDLDDIDI